MNKVILTSIFALSVASTAVMAEPTAQYLEKLMQVDQTKFCVWENKLYSEGARIRFQDGRAIVCRKPMYTGGDKLQFYPE